VRPRLAALAAVLLLALARPAVAQVPVSIPPPDSLAADSLAALADSVNPTDRLLDVDRQRQVRLRPLPRVGGGDLLPAGARIVFTRDSVDWAAARTVADLLVRGGAYLWRAGWLGRAEMPNVQARGAASVEYVVDGLPWLPMGADSTAVDPSLWSLTLLDRIEIERGPGLQRVHLYTKAHDRQAPRTTVGVTTGDRGFAQYAGIFERRWGSGIGLSVGAEYTGVNSAGLGTAAGNVTNGWVQFGWTPNPRYGVQAQALLQAAAREDVLSANPGASDTLEYGVDGTRTNTQLRAFWRQQDGDLGARVDALVGRTQWGSDSLDQDIGTMGVIGTYRRPTWSASLTTLHHTEWTSLDSRLALGWAPFGKLSASVEGVYQEHGGPRDSKWGTARVGLTFNRGERLLLGLRLPMGVQLGAVARDGRRIQTPALSDAVAQRFTDLEGSLALDFGRLAVSGRYARLDAWTPTPYRAFRRVATLAPVPETEWLGITARIAPLSWFTIESFYDHPMKGATPDGAPPHHAWTTATVRSKFLRNFPSGIFDLKVQGVVESWSPGIIGRDAEGEAIALPGTTFVRGIIQLQIGPFIAWYDRVNWQGTRQGHVSGYPIQTLGTTYGVRWEFAN
jgi:hypothetical protein